MHRVSDADGSPPSDVVAAFGGTGPVEKLPGGRGVTWRAGAVVLRPVEADGETEWASEVLARLEASDAFGVPAPLPDDRGSWTRDGWHALRWVPGAADPSRVDDVLRAGDAFHRALSTVAKPDFLERRSHPWARADRIAWSEEPGPVEPFLARLRDAYRPVDLPAGLIHGDLLGNVLFADGRAPAVIDWAPYWRPRVYADAIVVADAACWHGYALDRLGDDRGVTEWRQLLLRALVFRIATFQLVGTWSDSLRARHDPVVEAVLAL
ncbi:hypothetical protein [Leifsonia sp. 2MCAF36]|uniref:hypothetical protein n=1 Tax=Leifsonia sp. 2MCAF36 TaxID=3232988 RepID=UPI003F9E3A50